MLVAAFFAIFGHLFSVFVRFSGGKGIATSAGAFVALVPWAFLGAFIVFAVAFMSTRIVSVGSISAIVALPLLVFLSNRSGLASYHPSVLGMTLLMSVIMLFKHRSNIRHLLAGEEPVLRRHKKSHG